MENTTTDTTKARLYVGTYAKYNNGSIAGAWLDLEDYADAEEFMTACRELHKDESDPELMFQDFEGFPKELYSESMSTEDAGKLYAFLALDEEERAIVTAYAGARGTFPEDLDEAMEAYSGNFESDEDFAQDMAENTCSVRPSQHEWPFNCIDWELAARELMYDYCTHDGYYFRNC